MQAFVIKCDLCKKESLIFGSFEFNEIVHCCGEYSDIVDLDFIPIKNSMLELHHATGINVFNVHLSNSDIGLIIDSLEHAAEYDEKTGYTDNIPAINKIINNLKTIFEEDKWTCSKCNETMSFQPNFCPNCGICS